MCRLADLFCLTSTVGFILCVRAKRQDGAGWTPLMIAVSLKEGEDLVKLFLSKGADVNAKSEFLL
jgi:hypothetical protein